MTRIILVRHGQTDWNVNERFRGRFDVPLNSSGVHQAWLTAQRTKAEWKPTEVYSSPLSRAMTTAEAIARQLSLQVKILPTLVDMNFGNWEGLSPDNVGARWPDQLAAWYAAPHTVKVPGGESLDEVRQLRQDNCAINVIETDGNSFTLVSMNETCHLRHEMP